MDAVGKPHETSMSSVPPERSHQGMNASRLRLGAEGFLLGIAASSLLSIAAPLLLAPLTARLCYPLPPGQHFPPFPCVFLEALVFVLWPGPSALVWHVLLPSAATLTGVRATSAILVGLLSAGLWTAYGRRKGSAALLIISLALIVVLTVVSTFFVVSS
jgi:hypothetical protein